MKLIQAFCDISILTADQAWENYCNALHIARRSRIALDRHRWSSIARASLDRHFEAVEQRMKRANARNAV